MTGLDIALRPGRSPRSPISQIGYCDQPFCDLPQSRIFHSWFSIIPMFLFVFSVRRSRSIKMIHLKLDFRPFSRRLPDTF